MTVLPEPSDAAFLEAFEAGERPGGVFRHADHLRLAWLYLQRDGAALGEERIADGIRRFADAQGAVGLYHETLTRVWVRLVAAALAATPCGGSFPRFLEANPQLADKAYVFRFYSVEALSAARAREEWIEPDREPLP